jgi:hypothetical protein
MRIAGIATLSLACMWATACSTSDDPDTACAEASAAFCERANQCMPAYVAAAFGSTAACTDRVKLACAPRLSAAGTGTTAQLLKECSDALRSSSCDIFFGHSPPQPCRFRPGTLGLGAACAIDDQCQSTFCRRSASAACGTCGTRATSGGACETEDGCEYGLACSNKVCVPYGAFGAPCNKDQPCQSNLICRSGACAKAVGAGQPCDPLQKECDNELGLYCDPKSKVCEAAALAKAGEPCGVLASGAAGCSASFCSALVNGVCRAYAADGASCDDSSARCMPPARCVGGLCKLDDPAGCK